MVLFFYKTHNDNGGSTLVQVRELVEAPNSRELPDIHMWFSYYSQGSSVSRGLM